MDNSQNQWKNPKRRGDSTVLGDTQSEVSGNYMHLDGDRNSSMATTSATALTPSTNPNSGTIPKTNFLGGNLTQSRILTHITKHS